MGITSQSIAGAFVAERISYRGLGERFDGSGKRPLYHAWAVVHPDGKPIASQTFVFGRNRPEAQAREMAERIAAQRNAESGISEKHALEVAKQRAHEAECRSAAEAALAERARKRA